MPYALNPTTGQLDYYVAGDTSLAVANIRANVSPSESPNGATTTFTVPEAYIAGTLAVFLNGLHETHVSEASSTTFTFEDAPLTGDDIKITYAVEA